MTYNQFNDILERISIKINWDYKTILAPHVTDDNFLTNAEHPFSSMKKESITRKDKMTLSDLRNLTKMANK